MADTDKYKDIDFAAEYGDIAPYNQQQFAERVRELVHQPGFEHAVRYVMGDIDYDAFCKQLLTVDTQRNFQVNIMGGFLQQLEARTTDGVTCSGIENVVPGCAYTYISNHRDIVLDASFLNLCLLRHDRDLTQVAIGNNLLIMDWIRDLVKLNRSFIVKRDVKRLEALNAARQLSGYIHYTVCHSKECVWIAQRQGRAKDSNDMTQESLVKMLALAGGEDTKGNLMEINLLPASISYEYDPNDYLKVKEFLLRRRDPEFKKCEHDDLLSMETGLMGNKGRVHFHLGKCITPALAALEGTDRHTVIPEACRLIDRTIHANYCLYPVNFVAYDTLHDTDRFADRYTPEEKARMLEYFDERLAKVKVADITDDERAYMREVMLTMYANPVRNWIEAGS